MLKSILAAAALAGGFLAAAPASAMPVATDLGAQAGSGVTDVALYCNRAGVCVRAPRAGYYLRPAPVYRAPVRVYRAPVVRRNTVTKRTVVHRNNGTVVRKKTTVRR